MMDLVILMIVTRIFFKVHDSRIEAIFELTGIWVAAALAALLVHILVHDMLP